MGEIFQKIAGAAGAVGGGVMNAINAFKSGDIAGGIKAIMDTICSCCGGEGAASAGGG